jgi:hypothetical protein
LHTPDDGKIKPSTLGSTPSKLSFVQDGYDCVVASDQRGDLGNVNDKESDGSPEDAKCKMLNGRDHAKSKY